MRYYQYSSPIPQCYFQDNFSGTDINIPGIPFQRAPYEKIENDLTLTPLSKNEDKIDPANYMPI